jgi:hypothetical protein
MAVDRKWTLRVPKSLALRLALSVVGPVAAHATTVPGGPGQPVAIDIQAAKGALSIKMTVPFAAVVSFDRRPQTEAETAELDKAMTTLKNPSLLFEAPAAAGCTLRLVSLNTAITERSLREQSQANLEDSADPTVLQKEGTAGSLDVEYSVTCEKPKLVTQLSSPWFQVFPLSKALLAKATLDGKALAPVRLSPADSVVIPLQRIAAPAKDPKPKAVPAPKAEHPKNGG